MTTQTVAGLVPPKSPPKTGVNCNPDDYIRDIGDRIASLLPQEAKELNEYLELQGVKLPSDRV